jgi:hypothetical protein
MRCDSGRPSSRNSKESQSYAGQVQRGVQDTFLRRPLGPAQKRSTMKILYIFRLHGPQVSRRGDVTHKGAANSSNG